VSSRRKT